jgi:hypothetical protein
MTAFSRVLAKYDWAQKHVNDFEAAVMNFWRSNPHTIGREDNVETGHVHFYVQQVPVIPDELAFMLGDTLHNLRSTLDHLAYALVIAAGGTPDRDTSFPICNCAKDFPGLSRRHIPRLPEPWYKILDRIEPYEGGRGHRLWQLNKLDIIDKHRLLLTISTVPTGRSMTPREHAAFRARKTFIGPHTFAALQLVSAEQKPLSVQMQAGYELGVFPATDVDESMGFAFDVAINEKDIAQGIPTFLFLRGLASEILTIINNSAPYIRDKPFAAQS